MQGIGEIGVRVGADISEFTAGMNRTAQIAETSMRRAEQAQKIATAASDKFVASLKFQADTFGMADTQILKYKADLLGVGDAAAPLIARLEELKKTSSSATSAEGIKSSAHEMEGFSFKTAAAKRELIVLAHEMSQGNYSKFGGSMLVLAERTGAAAFLFNPLTLGIAAAGGALALLGYQVYKGHEDWNALGDSIKSTGDYTGYTQQQLDKMSVHFARSTAEIQSGREALVALISTGRFSGDQLQLVGRAALDMASDTGKSIDDVAKELAKLPDGARKWAEEYQKTHHVFTAANIELIDSLDKQGKQAAAVTATLDALNEAHKRVADTMRKDKGTWDRFWDDWADGLARIKNGLRAIGTPESDFDKINDALRTRTNLQTSLAAMSSRGDKESLAQVPAIQRQLDANLALIDSLRKLDETKKNAAKSNAAAGKSGDGQIAADKYLDGGTKSDAAKHKEAIEKENKEFNEATANLAKNSKTYEQVLAHHKENLVEIEKNYRSKTSKDDPTQIYLVASLKQMDGLIAQEKAQLKTREQDIARSVTAEFISTAEGLKQKREAIADDYAQTQALYAKEAAAVISRKAKLDPGTEKKAIAEQDKLLAEIEAKRALAAQASAAAMVQATGEQFKIQNDFNRATDEWVRQQGLANDAQQFSIDLMGKSALEAAQLTAARKTYLDVEDKIRLLQKKDPNADTSGITSARDAQIATGNMLAAERDAKQKDPWFNASESIRKYGETADNVGAQIGATMTNAFTASEDALVKFMTTGKLSLSGFTESIVAGLARIEAKNLIHSLIGDGTSKGGSGILGSLFDSGLSMLTGGISNATASASHADGMALIASQLLDGALASGGPVNSGGAYLVGEKGPELFSPSSAGTIIPNGSLGGSAGGTVHYNPVIHIDSRTDQADVHKLVVTAVRQGNANLIDQLQRSGRL
jgi:lambda family phage tail tape measure protein